MRTKYENEFKVTIVELLLSGKKPKDLSDEYNLDQSMIRRWKRDYESKSGDLSKKREVSKEALENKALRKELRNITEERDILKKAVSIFSKKDK
jgi:transposase